MGKIIYKKTVEGSYMLSKVIALREEISLSPEQKAIKEIIRGLNSKLNLKDKYVYIRGVAPAEAKEALRGKNGRVSDEKAITNRGEDKYRLAFGMNDRGLKGMSPEIMDELFLDLTYYANMGAYVEKYPHLGKGMHHKVSGYFLVFATDKPLNYHEIQLNYGDSWRTTSELTDDIENNLVAIFPAPSSTGPSSIGEFPKAGEIIIPSENREADIQKLSK